MITLPFFPGHNMNSWSSKSGSPPHHSLDKTLTSSRGKHHVLYESPDHSPSGSSGGGAGVGALSGSGRRRSLRSVDKHNSFLRSLSHETSSSSNNEFDEDMEAEMKKLLIQSKLRLANTEALKAKSHLLKPEDYVRLTIFYLCDVCLRYACTYCCCINTILFVLVYIYVELCYGNV